MPAATSQKSRKGSPQVFSLDPDDLYRRLSIVVAEQELEELERSQSHREADRCQAQWEQQDCNGCIHRAQSASFEDAYPNSKSAQKGSLPLVIRPQGDYMPQHMAASFLTTMDLETIEEADRDDKDNYHPGWTLVHGQRGRSSALTRVEGDFAPDCVDVERQTGSRRHSSLRHLERNWSQPGETRRGTRRRSSILERVGHYWRIQPNHTTDVAGSEHFHSDESTLRNSWRSSRRSSSASASRRWSSILKRVEDYWIVRPPPQDEETGEKMINSESDGSTLETWTAPRKPSFFSKFIESVS